MQKKNPFLKKDKHFYLHLSYFLFVTLSLIALIVIVILSLLSIITIQDFVVKIIFGLIGLLIPFEKSAIEKLSETSLWETRLAYLRRKGELKREDRIRISFASVLLIQIDGRYLLVKNPNGFQLYENPSRTYRLTNEELTELEIKYNVVEDSFIKKNYNDYRLLVPVKNIKSFYKYFCLHINPYEYDYSPMLDEVISLIGLNNSLFKESKIMFKHRIVNNIQYSRFTGYYELNVIDVCVFSPTKEQLDILRTLSSTSNPCYELATLEEIKHNGVNAEKGDLHAEIAHYVYDVIDENCSRNRTIIK